MTPAQLHSTVVSASLATIVASRGSSSSTVSASSTLIVLAGANRVFSSRPASTAPVSMSATIQASAGPAGIGTLPAGWLTPASGVAAAKGAVTPPTTPRSTARHARSLIMAAEPNGMSRSCSIEEC